MTTTAAAPAAGPSGAPDGTASENSLTHRQILLILSGLLLGMFLSALDQTIVATSIRVIADDLGGLSLQAWATTAFLITATITTPLYGKLSDLYGRRPLFLIAISVFIIGSVLCTIPQTMYQLAAFRAVQGLGAGGIYSLSFAILGDIVPPRQRARYMGYFLATFGMSSVAGPLVGGFFADQPTLLGIDGWRWVFLVNVPIAGVALTVVTKYLKLPHHRREHRIDWPGALLLAIALVPLLIVAEQGRMWGWGSDKAIFCYVVGILGLVLFPLAERHYGDDALLPLRLFRDPVFANISVTSVIIGMGMFGGVAVIPQYLQIVQGVSPTKAGLLSLPMMAGIMASSILSGQLLSRTGRYKPWPVIGSALMIVGLLLFARLDADTPLWQADIAMVTFGFGLGACLQPCLMAAQNAVPPQDMGVAASSVTFFRQMGGTLGTALFLSLLFSTVSGKITDAFDEAKGTAGFRSALTDPAVQADPVNRPILESIARTGNTDNATGVLDDSSFLRQIDDRLARPFQVGFADSISLVFLCAAGVVAIAFVFMLFLKELPLRTQSGIDALAAERAAAAHPAAAPTAAESHLPQSNGRLERYGVVTSQARYGKPEWHEQEPEQYGEPQVGNGSPVPAPNYPPPTEPRTRGAEVPTMGAGGVEGRVTGGDGAPLAGAAMTLTDLGGRQVARSRTDQQGQYQLVCDHAGSYLVICAADGFPPNAAVVAVGRHLVRHDVALSGSAALSGRVRMGSRPLEGIAVTLIDGSGEVMGTCPTSATGDYEFDGLAPGRYTVTTATTPPVAKAVEVSSGTQVQQDLDLPERSRLTGVVRSGGTGSPVGEALTTLVDSEGRVVGSAVTGPDGVFSFEGLPQGSYTLTAAGYRPVATTVQVDSGSPAQAEVVLQPPTPLPSPTASDAPTPRAAAPDASVPPSADGHAGLGFRPEGIRPGQATFE